MQTLEEKSGSGRYLISCVNPDKLNEFISTGYEDPSIQLIDTVGPIGSPHTAVYEMSHAKAAQLKQLFSTVGELKIEADQSLSMFEKQ
ncbi:MAG: hypothetical protein LW714_02505 [Oxalobacteraceae bacterium]|jgi:hypothetical protein|nr:hypothetical protein [Oxalobacteraceae bacterium]